MFVYTIDDVCSTVKFLFIIVIINSVLAGMASAFGVSQGHLAKLVVMMLVYSLIVFLMSRFTWIEASVVALITCGYVLHERLHISMHPVFWIVTFCGIIAVIEALTHFIGALYLVRSIAMTVVSIAFVKYYFLSAMTDRIWIGVFAVYFLAINIFCRIAAAESNSFTIV